MTLATVSRLGLAIARQGTKNGGPVLIARDTRALGESFVTALAESLCEAGVAAVVASRPLPTPVLAWATRQGGYTLGLSVTASHNPAETSGIKLRLADGGPPEPALIAELTRSATTIQSALRQDAAATGWPVADPWPAYVAALRSAVDLDLIDQAAPAVVVDAMHGTTAGLLADVLAGTRAQVTGIRSMSDPGFGGVVPEPTPTSIGPLVTAVAERRAHLGVAHDGDGDRMVAYTPACGYLPPGELLCLLAWTLARDRGERGAVVASVVTTSRAERVARVLGRRFYEVPVGFWHASQRMRLEPVLAAGEENGRACLGTGEEAHAAYHRRRRTAQDAAGREAGG